MERIMNIGNNSIDFERIRIVKQNIHTDLGKTNVVVIEYNARIEYSKNPFTNEIEKNLIIDKIEIEYSDFETAQYNVKSIQETWNEYLESKKEYK